MQYNNFGFSPYGYQSMQQPSGLTQVTGIEGAKAYQTPPNSTVPLFDSDDAVFYVKTTDNIGNTSVRVFDFQERKPAVPAYVTQDEFNQLNDKIDKMLEVINGKSAISKAPKDTTDRSDDDTAQSATPSRRRRPSSSL